MLWFITGQTFSHKPQLIQMFVFITGYLNPSLSVVIAMQALGHIEAHAVQPQQSFLFLTDIFIIKSLVS